MRGKHRVLAIGLMLVASMFRPTASQGQTSKETPESIASNFVANLKAGKAETAVSGYFAGSSLASTKSQEMGILNDQITSVIRLYGQIHQCELVQTSKVGTMVETQMFLCQQDNFVTRWTLQMVRVKNGWIGGNLAFDDKVSLPLGER